MVRSSVSRRHSDQRGGLFVTKFRIRSHTPAYRKEISANRPRCDLDCERAHRRRPALARSTEPFDRYTFSSPRIRTLQEIQDKIRPETKPEPFPPLKHYEPRERADVGDGEIPFRPTYDARECAICLCPPDRMVCYHQVEPGPADYERGNAWHSHDRTPFRE
jgi:hypothetical protein